MKKIISLVLVAVLCMFSFTACGKNTDSANESEAVKEYKSAYRFRDSRLVKTEYQDLYYDEETNIVYIVFESVEYKQSYGYMSVYLGPNGRPCKYNTDTKQIDEITN